ncbi:MAG: GNAT family N-acetyltransferase [Candidatus Zixiibacteriota bacterium]
MEPVDDGIVIRPLRPGEIPRLWGLWRDSGVAIRSAGRDTLAELSRQQRTNPEGFLGAFAATNLVGSVIATDDTRRGWINRLAVHPENRQARLGARLLQAAERELRRRGLFIIGAHIEADNHASRALYLFAGYKPDERDRVLFQAGWRGCVGGLPGSDCVLCS